MEILGGRTVEEGGDDGLKVVAADCRERSFRHECAEASCRDEAGSSTSSASLQDD